MTANRYEVIMQLAQGGMGEILLARRLGAAGFEKLVVLKRPLRISSPQLVAALIDEARLLARINHPNVCQVYDLEQGDDGQFFFAMEYLDGLSLWAITSDAESTSHPIDPRIACAIFEQVCEGLDAIHSLRERDGSSVGVIHRDISPGNLFVTTNGTVKILDLGIAKTTDSEELTPYGRVKGKMSYLSPEQVSGKPVDCRADLFALGLVIYDLARGKRPPRDRIGALACDALELAALPPALAAIVRKAVATEPDARFGSASEMAAALRDAGIALGGTRNRAELAAWLANRFEADLAKRKGHVDDQLGGGRDTDTATQVLDLRSVIGLERDRSQLLSRETERLQLPDHERFTSLGGGEVVRAHVANHSRVLAVVGAVVVIAMAIVLVAVKRGGPRDVQIAAAADATPTGSSIARGVAPTPAMPAMLAAEPPAPTPPAPPAAPPRTPPMHAQVRHHAEHPVAGQITVGSRPFAVVWLGKRALGPTPIYRVSIPPGHYQLHASIADGRTQDVSVEIESGQENRLRLDWPAK